MPRISSGAVGARQLGFSLIELMIAITLGLLLMLGITTLFTNTNNTNRTQDALARMQENGRYAMSRLTDDLRSAMVQPLSFDITAQSQIISSAGNGILIPPIAANVHIANLETRLPRWAGGTVMPAGWTANTPYPLSPRWFLQGHECNFSGACTPALPAGLPGAGTGVGQRVRGADVLTVRYINSPGWSLAVGATIQTCPAGKLAAIDVEQLPNRPPTNFVTGDLAMIWGGSGAAIFQVNVTGAPGANQVLVPTPGSLIGGLAVDCFATTGTVEPVLYNFSRDLRSVTYFLQIMDDPSPDAAATRVIPTLMRWANDAAAPEVVAQGVERLDFLYAVENRNAAVSYLTADVVQNSSSAAACNNPPIQYTALPAGSVEPGCLWRSVRTIEMHALFNTVNDVFSLLPSDEAFRYSMNNGTALVYNTPAIPTSLPTGLDKGRMMRREFTAQVALRGNLP